jgi:transaldolase
MPQGTLDAVADHGDVRGESITSNVQQSHADVEALANLGISLDDVADKLEREGLEKFVTPWLQLIEVVEKVARGDNA